MSNAPYPAKFYIKLVSFAPAYPDRIDKVEYCEIDCGGGSIFKGPVTDEIRQSHYKQYRAWRESIKEEPDLPLEPVIKPVKKSRKKEN